MSRQTYEATRRVAPMWTYWAKSVGSGGDPFDEFAGIFMANPSPFTAHDKAIRLKCAEHNPFC